MRALEVSLHSRHRVFTTLALCVERFVNFQVVLTETHNTVERRRREKEIKNNFNFLMTQYHYDDNDMV